MNQLSVRELEEKDIPLVDGYWRSMTPDDLARMHIDPAKVLPSVEFRARILKNLRLSVTEKAADPLIWEVDGIAVGMTNLNNITRGVEADIHLHLFASNDRKRGYGRRLFVLSSMEYLKRHDLKRIICQPASTNPGPNGLMRALGIPITKTYRTLPSVICFEHEVNRYELDYPLLKPLSEHLSPV